MSKHPPKIRAQAKSGVGLIREGLSIDFYMHPHSKMGQGVIRALDAYLRAVGSQSLSWYADEEGELQKLDDASLARIRRETLEDSRLIIELLGKSRVEQRYQFEYWGKRPDLPVMPYNPGAMGVVSFWLPTEYLEEHGPTRVRELAMELASSLPFICSGYGGLSFHCNPSLVGVLDEVRKLCFRYPGLDIPNQDSLSWNIGSRVRGPAWLTFLGQPLLGQLGGVAELRSRLRSEGTTVQEMEGDRAVITLGAWPEAGDTERGEVLPAYRDLARVLEPWLYHEERGRRPTFTPEDMLRWERRFLD
ncbi:DUF3396 domain-containing protein [Archangium violaceum]|uniref:DUF3396 domain-containing protein n=1 Tax=Archangium violaceum TaxID=83451 RepID=UPI0019501D6D|nr:DUF3396 domain-containing protein [Archangium violaceum]QRN95938.1 DUF3396 domain-containing protein [Archangium violaceum]